MKKYPGIRYGFRPTSYWDDLDPLSVILRNVTGETRRQIITDYWKAGRLEELDSALLQDESDPDQRFSLGAIHPTFMGGEFLPSYVAGEVEIARICLQSTTADVISLRARAVPGGITYRVEDEYDGKFTLPITSSEKPLTLAEVIRQFEQGHLEEVDYPGGLALGYNNLNAESSEPAHLRHFTRIYSSPYPQLESHFERVFEDWVAEETEARTSTEEGGAP